MRAVVSTHVCALLTILPLVSGQGAGQPRPSAEKANEPVVREALEQVESTGAERGLKREIRTTRLEYADAEAVSSLGAEVLGSVAASERKIPPAWFADARTNTLVVTAWKDQLPAVEALIAELDVPGLPMVETGHRYATHFQLAVFETQVRQDRIVDLEAGKLVASADTCRSLQDTLGEFGATKIRYRVDQTVELASRAKLIVGANSPFKRGGTKSKSGAVTTQVEYEETGCVAQLFGAWDETEPTLGHATVSLELSGRSDSPIDLGNKILAPVFHKIEQRFDGPVTAGKPVVLLTVDASNPGETAVAYVTWILFQRTR